MIKVGSRNVIAVKKGSIDQSVMLGSIGIGNISEPWVAYDKANTVMNIPAASVEKSMTSGYAFTYSNYGMEGTINGSAHVGILNTKNEDGTYWLPTKGCRYLDLGIYAGSRSYYSLTAHHWLYGKKADGSEVLIENMDQAISQTPYTNDTWAKMDLDISEYEYIRIALRTDGFYGTTCYGAIYINRIEFHD